MNDLRDAAKNATGLVQGELVVLGLRHDDVNTALAGLESDGVFAVP